mmetsp:Transcript_7458/g.11279  ORF Transcript_7458/g.11279 Transcript_7458/m.11279 type:complete len:419 (-) Transcript_7458:27-1283(-)
MPPAFFVDAKRPSLGDYVTGRSDESNSQVNRFIANDNSSKTRSSQKGVPKVKRCISNDRNSKENDNDSKDKELIRNGENHFQQDRLLAAARMFLMVKDKSLLQRKHLDIVENAKSCEGMVAELKSPVNAGWTKIGESHGDHDTVIYFKMEKDAKITCRLETPIEPSLLVPLLSVLNETDLYQTWLPSWKRPVRIGVTQSNRLQQTGRASQIVLIKCDVPWPLNSREGVISALAFEDIDSTGDIFIRLQSRDTGDDGGIVPPPDNPKTQRVQVQGGFLFRKCPWDHPTLRNKGSSGTRIDKEYARSNNGNDLPKKGIHKDNLILVSVSYQIDAKIQMLPQSAINFILKTVVGAIWARFLQVAEDVRDGRRPQHADAIAKKRGVLYDWVDERVQKMLSNHSTRYGNISREDIEFIHYLAS